MKETEWEIWVPFLYLVLCSLRESSSLASFSRLALELSERGCHVPRRAWMSKTHFCQGS